MSRVVTCPHCERKLSIREEMLGKKLGCPQCKGQFRLPPADPPAAEILPQPATPPAAAPAPTVSEPAPEPVPEVPATAADPVAQATPAPTPEVPVAAAEPKPVPVAEAKAVEVEVKASPAGVPAAVAPLAEPDFFAGLSAPAAATRPAAAVAARPAPAARAVAAQPAAAAARVATRPAARSSKGGLAAITADPKFMWYLIGGAAGLFLLVVILVVAMSGGSSPSGKSGKTKDYGPEKYGLTGKQRHQVFYEMLETVDNHGEQKARSDHWPDLAKRAKVDMGTLDKIMEEGLNNSVWSQPSYDATAQRRANRKAFMLKHNQAQAQAGFR